MNPKWLLGGFVGAALTTTVVTLSSEGTLKEVEVIFYDNDTSSTDTKSVKVPLDNLSNSSYFKYKDTDGSFKWISSVDDADDKNLYLSLSNIAAKYIRTQHQLNVIKYSIWDENKDQILKNNKCCPCCTQNGQAQCTCTNGKCCYMCLGCYSDNTKKQSGENCCTAVDNLTWEKFKKNQKTFKNLMSSIYSGYHNTYLSPVQVNIKFTDKKFSDIKDGLKESNPSATDYTSFIGSLTYGFVDYGYKHTTYKSGLLQNLTDGNTDITDGSSDVFFSTIPQKFSFAYKLKADDDISGSEALKKRSIDAVLKKVDQTHDVINEYKSKTIDSLESCCKDSPTEEDVIKCLLGRNYVFLSKDDTDLKVADIIKDIKPCCLSALSP